MTAIEIDTLRSGSDLIRSGTSAKTFDPNGFEVPGQRKRVHRRRIECTVKWALGDGGFPSMTR